MRNSSETGRHSNEIVREGTNSGEISHNSRDSSTFQRSFSDQSGPKNPNDYFFEITKNAKWLTHEELKEKLPQYRETLAASRRAEASLISSPLAQSFMSFLKEKMPEKENPDIAAIKQKLIDITHRQQKIENQIIGSDNSIARYQEWAQETFQEWPDIPQNLKNDYEQAYQKALTQKGSIRDYIANEAQNYDDIHGAERNYDQLIAVLQEK